MIITQIGIFAPYGMGFSIHEEKNCDSTTGRMQKKVDI